MQLRPSKVALSLQDLQSVEAGPEHAAHVASQGLQMLKTIEAVDVL